MLQLYAKYLDFSIFLLMLHIYAVLISWMVYSVIDLVYFKISSKWLV